MTGTPAGVKRAEKFANGTADLITTMMGTSVLELRLSSPVTHVSEEASGVTVTTASGGVVSGSACVVAVPSNVIRRIEFLPRLSAEKRAATAENHVGRTSLEMAQKAIEFYFPEGRVIASDAHDWNRDPWFDGTYRIEAPGRAHAFPRIMNVPEGRLFFAGSDMAPSVFRSFWMEGAIESGHLAAEKVLAFLSVPAERERQRQIAT